MLGALTLYLKRDNEMKTMDWQKFILYCALFVVGLMLWTNWQKQYVPAPQATAVVQTTGQSGQPLQQAGGGASAITSAPSSPAAPAIKTHVPANRIVGVSTDVLNVKIDTHGGDLIFASLSKFPKDLSDPNQHVVLFSDDANKLYLAQSGLVSNNKHHNVVFTSSQKQYVLTDGQKQLQVVLNGQTANGLNVEKIFSFEQGSYLIKIETRLKNNSGKTWNGQQFNQFTRKKVIPPKKGFFQISSFMGAAVSDPQNKMYQKLSFKKMSEENLNSNITGGWVAMQQHYFLSAWVPPGKQQSLFYTRDEGNEVFTVGYFGPQLSIAPGAAVTTTAKLYVGPEKMSALKQIAPGLDMTIDFGILWFLSIGIFWLLTHIHSFVGNWGWSIVLVTVLIKLAFYKLSASSYKSMANMRKLTPKIEQIKERYKDDKQRLSKSMMELYKKEKINPLGGCLPILIQIPVFIALYWVLLESVELRQAPFILWIHDLALPDPFYVLPVIMGITMFVQQKLNPPPPDPMQAKVMMFLPVLFTVLFLSFPAGLVLYWVVNNGLSILQQWHITRQIENAPTTKTKRRK